MAKKVNDFICGDVQLKIEIDVHWIMMERQNWNIWSSTSLALWEYYLATFPRIWDDYQFRISQIMISAKEDVLT